MFVKQQAERINFKPFEQTIKSTREKKGLTRKELAAQIRISPRYIASIENSEQTPSLQVFYEKMKLIPTRNMAAYLRKIAIDGYIIQIDHTKRKRRVQAGKAS